MTQTSTHQDQYLAQFEAFEAGLSLNGTGWLGPVRKAALGRFRDLGFPTARRGNEAWKYTSVAPIAREPFTFASDGSTRGIPWSDVQRLAPRGQGWTRLVFIDGRYDPALSSPPPANGLRVVNLAQAAADDRGLVERHLTRYAPFGQDAFTALNTAFLHDGAFVSLAPAQSADTTVHLIFVASGQQRTISHPRTLIVAGEGSRVTVVESYVSLADAAHFTNAVTEIVLEAGAALDHYRLSLESTAAYHVGITRVRVDRDASLTSTAIAWGSALVRNDLGVTLDGPGASCQLNGLYVTTDSQHVDNQTFIDHASHHTTSRQYYKGVLDGKSRAVFSGRVRVRPDAQQTDARQANRNLVLSDGAEIDTKPSLEILADDVKCSHGATAGRLDEDALFYLLSRGLDSETARGVLVRAFAREIIDTIRLKAVGAFVTRLFSEKLPALQERG
ncbi:MAG: Fe-S cluster assembly protein SufD [Dehalococcoidia bacterium]